MDMARRLTMTCDITPVLGQGNDAEPTYGTTIEDILCYCYGNTRRFRDTKGQEYIPEFRVMFFGGTDVDNNYKIEDIRDKDGRLILDSGYITNVNPYDHPRNGPVLVEAYVSKR